MRAPVRRLHLASLLAVAAALPQCGSDNGSAQAPRLTYQAVPGWPTLPGGRKLGCVTGLAVDGQDRVYVAHSGSPPIACFTRQGEFVRAWGAGDLEAPRGLRVEGDTVWVTDTSRHQVFAYSLDGELIRTLGRDHHPGTEPDRFNKPADVAVGPNGDLYVADGLANARIVRLSPDGEFRGAWGTQGSEPGQFRSPTSIRLDAQGNLYVADRDNRRIQVLGPDGTPLYQWDYVGRPLSLFLTHDQHLFAVDAEAHRVLRMSLEGKILQAWGTEGTRPGQFELPSAVCVDSYGDVYVGEFTARRVQKFVPRLVKASE